MGHHEKKDPPQLKSVFCNCLLANRNNNVFRSGRSRRKEQRKSFNSVLTLVLTFMLILSLQIQVLSAETVEGFAGIFPLPANSLSSGGGGTQKFRSILTTETDATSSSSQQSSPPVVIKYLKPKISLSVIKFEYGSVVASKTILQYTDSNVTKIIDEEDDLDDNGVEGYEYHGLRPGANERTGVPPEPLVANRVLRLECMSNFPVEFKYEGCGVC